jgi:hypothetical protein
MMIVVEAAQSEAGIIEGESNTKAQVGGRVEYAPNLWLS